MINETLKSAAASVLPASPENQIEEFFNKKETAGRLKVTTRTLENWQRRGVIPFVKVGKVVLFHWPDVVEHLKSNFRVCRKTIIK